MNQKFEDAHPRIKRLRELLDSWRFWAGVAFCVTALLVIYSVGLYSAYSKSDKALTTSQKQEAIRLAQERTVHINTVTDCFATVKSQPIIDGFFEGQKEIIRNQIKTTQDSLNATPATDPLNDVRIRSLKRLSIAQKNGKKLAALIAKRRKTKAQCLDLAVLYNVPVPAEFSR